MLFAGLVGVLGFAAWRVVVPLWHAAHTATYFPTIPIEGEAVCLQNIGYTGAAFVEPKQTCVLWHNGKWLDVKGALEFNWDDPRNTR